MEDEDDDSDGEGLVIQEDEDADAEKGDDGTDGGDGAEERGVSPDSRLDSSNKAGEKEESPKAEEKALEEMPVPSGKTDKNKAITDEILKD